MKRFLALVFCFLLLLACSVQAESIDLSGYSFEELLILQQRVNTALFESPEWKEVEVPMGVWDVGKDIPAGRWELRKSPNSTGYWASVVFYLKRTNGQPDYMREMYHLKTPEDSAVLELEEGNVIKIEDASVVFRRYVPSFNFD